MCFGGSSVKLVDLIPKTETLTADSEHQTQKGSTSKTTGFQPEFMCEDIVTELHVLH